MITQIAGKKKIYIYISKHTDAFRLTPVDVKTHKHVLVKQISVLKDISDSTLADECPINAI